jgi:hypothetical protein
MSVRAWRTGDAGIRFLVANLEEPVAQSPWCWDSAVLPLAMFKCVFE